MKVSLSLAQEFGTLDVSGIERTALLQKIGTQLGAVESVTDWRQKYEGVIVVKVVRCEKHPNADSLHVCFIDDGGVVEHVERGEDGLIQVVCGAPNVASDMFVAWIPPEIAVPSTRQHDPFVLEARDIRGIVSNGMLASAKELDVSDDHEGLLHITEEEAGRTPVVGEPLHAYFGLDDFVIDCENKMFTHRPDCFGNLGVARELAGITGQRFVSPDWYLETPQFQDSTTISLQVTNTIQELVPRFTAVVMKDVTVSKSPIWLQSILKRVGIKSINTVVDITNYVMHVTGQPLHAFDYDKLSQLSDIPSLQPRMAKKGEKLALLNDKEIELSDGDMVIATDTTPVALAGIMGGAATEVDFSTKIIVIECANFDMYAIRRTSMRHGLFTDAVTRFNKGQSPLQNDRVLAYAMRLMQNLTSAIQASKVYDIAAFDTTANNLNTVDTTVAFINERLGTKLSIETIKTLLENVEFTVETQAESLHITAPFWRMDVAIAEDIVEEVGRLYGYGEIEAILPARNSKPTPLNPQRVFKASVRQKMKELGANELLTYSFVHGDMLRSVGIAPETWAYHLRNAISPELQYYRPSLLPSLLAKVHPNIKAQAGTNTNAFMLYELGKVHVKGHMEEDEPNLPKQFHRLAAVFAADAKSYDRERGSAYYCAKAYIDCLSNGQAEYLPLDTNEYPIAAPFQLGRSAVVSIDGAIIGVVGEFHTKARQAFKLPEACAGFEIDSEQLRQLITPKRYQSMPAYPPSSQDITLEVSGETSWGSVWQLLHAELAVSAAENDYIATIEPIALYAPKEEETQRFTFRVTLAHHHKTLKTAEVTAVLDALAESAHEKLQAVRI